MTPTNQTPTVHAIRKEARMSEMKKEKTRRDLVDWLVTRSGLHRSSAIAALQGIENFIVHALCTGKSVRLNGLMTIEPYVAAPRKGHDFKTGATLDCPGRRAVRVRVSKILKKKINQSK